MLSWLCRSGFSDYVLPTVSIMYSIHNAPICHTGTALLGILMHCNTRMWYWLFRVRVFFSRSFSLSRTLMYPSFCSVGLLSSKLLPEVISAILKRYVLWPHPPISKCLAEKWALNAGNGVPTRWDCLFLTPFMPKRTEIALPCQTSHF